jgi:hypothetical protein
VRSSAGLARLRWCPSSPHRRRSQLARRAQQCPSLPKIRCQSATSSHLKFPLRSCRHRKGVGLGLLVLVLVHCGAGGHPTGRTAVGWSGTRRRKQRPRRPIWHGARMVCARTLVSRVVSLMVFFILFVGQVPLFYLVGSNSPCSSLSIPARRTGFVFAQLEQLPWALEGGASPVPLPLTLQPQARTDACRGDHQMSLGDWECRTWFGVEGEGIVETD